VPLLRRKTEIIITIAVVIIAAASLFAYFTYGSGTLEIKISDPLNDWGQATQVYINYSAIEIHRAQADNESGWFTIVEKSAWINLTKILDFNQTISYTNLQAGLYNQIRFRILEARVTVDNKNYTASVPSDELKIAITPSGIQINTGQTATMLIEINMKVEGSKASGFFRLIPAVKATQV
jgi:hypothetical protein